MKKLWEQKISFLAQQLEFNNTSPYQHLQKSAQNIIIDF